MNIRDLRYYNSISSILPGGFRYSYVLNNPLKYADPSGYVYRYSRIEWEQDVTEMFRSRGGGGGGANRDPNSWQLFQDLKRDNPNLDYNSFLDAYNWAQFPSDGGPGPENNSSNSSTSNTHYDPATGRFYYNDKVGQEVYWKGGEVYVRPNLRRVYIDMTSSSNKNLENVLDSEATGVAVLMNILLGESSAQTLKEISKSDASYKLLNKIKAGSRIVGPTVSGAILISSMVQFGTDPSLGTFYRMLFNGVGFAGNFGGPVLKGLGIGLTVADVLGAFDSMYDSMDEIKIEDMFNYNSTDSKVNTDYNYNNFNPNYFSF